MTPKDIPGHDYLRENHEDWEKGMATLRAEGWPWWCESCSTASFLPWRCSKCGRDLASEGTTTAR